MKTDYIRHLVDEIAPGQGVVYPVIHGINVSTVYITQVQKHLAEQPEGQFTVTRGNGDLNVRLCTENKQVCQECGSPMFWTRVTEDFESFYHDDNKLHTKLLIERKVQNRCRYCGTLHLGRVHRYPEIIP